MPRQFGKETVKGIFEREPEKIPENLIEKFENVLPDKFV